MYITPLGDVDNLSPISLNILFLDWYIALNYNID